MSAETSMKLQCGSGTIINLEANASIQGKRLLDYGIISKKSSINTFCSTEVLEEDKICDYIDGDAFEETLLSQCQGKNFCLLENLGQFVNSDDSDDTSGCFHEDALMFV